MCVCAKQKIRNESAARAIPAEVRNDGIVDI